MITVKRARRVVDLVTDLSLQEQYTEALRMLDAAKNSKSGAGTEVGNPALREAAEKVQAIEAEMAGSTIRFTLEAVDRKRWNEFVEAHPAAEGNADDREWGFSLASLDDLLPESIKAVHDSDGKPYDFDPKAEWKALSAELSDGQFGAFIEAMILVNRGSSSPKSKAASLVIRASSQS